MPRPPDPKDHPDHIPIEKRLSGDFGSPLELLASRDLDDPKKRAILEVWLHDIETQPDSPETRKLRSAIQEALHTLETA